MDGTRPISGFSKYKERLDKVCGLSGWRLHDLRRTMRSHISTLPVEEKTRELVIAHAKRGLDRVYDQHGYRDEKRRCLALWEARLLGIVKPTPVVSLNTARRVA